MSDIKILVVDDDPEILTATTRIAQSLGHKVFGASDGAQCRELLKRHQPDLVLLDVVLPDTDGHTLCKEIKADPELERTLVLIASGMKISSSDQAEGLETGADGYIARPISNRELKARIAAMVRILLAERERDLLVIELRSALDKVQQMRGLLPICAHCKSIRDDEGYWNRVEAYIEAHSKAQLSHGICPECAKKYYPGMKIYEDA